MGRSSAQLATEGLDRRRIKCDKDGMSTITTITEFRKSKKMTAKQFGDLFCVDRATVYRWERGDIKVPIKILGPLEDVTGIPREKLRPDIFEAQQ